MNCEQMMPRGTRVRLGIYSEKAVSFISRAVIDSSVIPLVDVNRLPDGEVVLELLAAAHGSTEELKKKLIRRIGFVGRQLAVISGKYDEAAMYLQLAGLLKNQDAAEDAFGFRGVQRDVLKASAIEAIQNEIRQVEKEAENAIVQIAHDRDEKVEKLQAKLAEFTE